MFNSIKSLFLSFFSLMSNVINIGNLFIVCNISLFGANIKKIEVFKYQIVNHYWYCFIEYDVASISEYWWQVYGKCCGDGVLLFPGRFNYFADRDFISPSVTFSAIVVSSRFELTQVDITAYVAPALLDRVHLECPLYKSYYSTPTDRKLDAFVFIHLRNK